MHDRILAGFGVLVGLAAWAVGGWRVYDANTLPGALLVLTGGLLTVFSIAWWRRDPEVGFRGVLDGVVEFLSPAR